jgi:DDE superfamily endonuclease
VRGQPLRDVRQYIFLDECGVTTDLLRRYGRSPRGTRLRDHTPCRHWQTHTVVGLRMGGLDAAAVEQRGARLQFLPPYSPDFNPIELAFAKLKAFLRAARPRTFDHVVALVKSALELCTPSECRNFIRHADTEYLRRYETL